MAKWYVKGHGGAGRSWLIALLAPTFLPVGIVLSTTAMTPRSGTATSTVYAAYKSYALSLTAAQPATAPAATFLKATAKIPAFARKYNMPCSACHTIWPQLNAFGQKFKDNGYQLGNDRDAPIWLAPSYWPISLRTTPNWHYESISNQLVDGTCGLACESKTLSQSGFDITGIDVLTLGTLYKNITFGLTPASDATGAFHIETAYVRFDNLGDNPWINVKMGKFELDNLLSEKRILTLSGNGGLYLGYHFLPPNTANDFGLGDNQIGAEWMGHSPNSYSRASFAILSSTDGAPGIASGHSYDVMFTASQAFDTHTLGPQRVGVFAYRGERPTTFQTVNGLPTGSASDNKGFYRVGALADLFFGNFMVTPLFLHGEDDVALTSGGDQNPSWNAILVQAEYMANERLVFIGRYEDVSMQKQAISTDPKSLGNQTQFVLGVRSYPFMWSRSGLALHGEYAMIKTEAPPGPSVTSSSVMFGLDFAF